MVLTGGLLTGWLSTCEHEYCTLLTFKARLYIITGGHSPCEVVCFHYFTTILSLQLELVTTRK